MDVKMDEGFRRGHGFNLMPILRRASITFVHVKIFADSPSVNQSDLHFCLERVRLWA
jgi:hypothetical protein